MQNYDPMTSFGQAESIRYDDEDTRGDEEQTVAFLARLASGREVLEFAVGTGRIALPLAAAGVAVDGIEMSPHMVERLRENPGGDAITVTAGDMSRASTGRNLRTRLSGVQHDQQPAQVESRVVVYELSGSDGSRVNLY